MGAVTGLRGGTFQYVSFLDECPAYHYAIDQEATSFWCNSEKDEPCEAQLASMCSALVQLLSFIQICRY